MYEKLLKKRPEFAKSVATAQRRLSTDPFVKEAREWLAAFTSRQGGSFQIDDGVVRIQPRDDFDQASLEKVLQAIAPWRKGPFCIGDLSLEAEWRSDWKWNRVLPLMPNLKGKRVCDVGANNGYYLFHMLEYEPSLLLGLEPAEIYIAQFEVLAALSGVERDLLAPVGIEALDEAVDTFDIIFLMGILYHRTDPVAALRTCSRALRPGGRVVLETIVVPGDKQHAWFAGSTYAGARGFYFLPTQSCLEQWVIRSNLKIEHRSPMVRTTAEEQRGTRYRQGASLEAGLAPGDPTKTVEGLPAPHRVVWMLKR